MKKIQSGNSYIFTDEINDHLESQLINPPGEVTILGTVGDFNMEVLASLFQVAPAIYGRVFGLTKESLQFVANKFDTGASRDFAKVILIDQEFFEELMSSLVRHELVRQKESKDGKVYFPTEKYLRSCQLLCEAN